ncbi:ABC transporter permease subunit [Anaerocolumna sp. AGMB13025]|uniref:ABC transporter permease n=1 Tax=Anaerocolumna sp. AGMB13025 TaxID=3039116 RepID=UPI00241E2F3A|nr:ABC transporter permease subunit [Anaerocolumna sp. AGMB13025]WFR58353.1 ABC transporter permease subunit [Anaerocolumna sp. AGMB13025]
MKQLWKDLRKNKAIYLMLLPVMIYLFIFNYMPMYGILISFKNFKPRLGILESPWVGFKYFEQFFSSIYFGRVLSNTLWISGLNLLFGFVTPVIFALLLNEIRVLRYKKLIQTVTYLPHFITTVVISGIILKFTNGDGFITSFINTITHHSGSLISDSNYFRSIYVISDIWQGFGWGSIIYIAAISGIQEELYEAARIDGAGRFRQIRHVTIPGIMPTVVIMFILAVGGLMSVGWEKAFLLQTPLTYDTSDIISTYVYRKGFIDMNYSYSSAVGLFNSAINLVLLTGANRLSRKVNETSLW